MNTFQDLVNAYISRGSIVQQAPELRKFADDLADAFYYKHISDEQTRVAIKNIAPFFQSSEKCESSKEREIVLFIEKHLNLGGANRMLSDNEIEFVRKTLAE